jgi:hypothetical protein
MKTPMVLFAALLLVQPLCAQSASDPGTTQKLLDLPAPVVPALARQGDALLVWIPRPADAVGFSGEAILRGPDGKVIKRSTAFALLSGHTIGSDACALGIPMTAAPGAYTIELTGTRGGAPWSSSHALEIQARDFFSEDIPLTPSLTSIRADPSPRKDDEARTYAKIIAHIDPTGAWLDGPFLRPVASERRTSRFGDQRRYIYSTGGTDVSVHAGIDFAAPTGTPVIACGRGRVVLAQNRAVTGNTVILEHLPGVYTIYMHMSTLAVAQGDIVERGASLGTVGATGLATGPHLHWELRVCGEACDPESPAFAGLFPHETSAPATAAK